MHHRMEFPEKYKIKNNASSIKRTPLVRNKVYKIKKVSAKQRKLNEEYSAQRKEWFMLPENQKCRVYPHLDATDVHHMKGRGKFLLVKEYWLPVSREGHNWIEEHPAEAKRLGFTLTRV